jgi:inner membrane protein
MQEYSDPLAFAAAVVRRPAWRPVFAVKAIVVGILTLVLLVPLGQINDAVRERQAYRQQAVASVAESYAGAQTLAGPVLVVPFVETVQVVEEGAYGKPVPRQVERASRWIFFPASLSLQGQINPAVRKRGLHEVRVYELQSALAARFHATLPADAPGARRLGTPYLSFAIADVRGLAGQPELKLDGTLLALQQGVGGHRQGGGVHALLAPMQPGQRLDFTVALRSTLAGTESLSVVPIADNNTIALRSSWPHPQFAGRFLPRRQHIDGAGFQARWQVSSLAAGSQGQYRQALANDRLDGLKVGLVEPVNIYSQADRASKYGILFILLTFVAFFMFELLKRLPIHPIQYALVGLSLAIFFLLLLSLSEHLPFWLSYLIASGACIGLLAIYLSAVLRSRARGLGFAAGLTLLYAALYGLLVSEDNALVLGSLMLFVILAALMLVTRRTDWYAAGSTEPVAAEGG